MPLAIAKVNNNKKTISQITPAIVRLRPAMTPPPRLRAFSNRHDRFLNNLPDDLLGHLPMIPALTVPH